MCLWKSHESLDWAAVPCQPAQYVFHEGPIALWAASLQSVLCYDKASSEGTTVTAVCQSRDSTRPCPEYCAFRTGSIAVRLEGTRRVEAPVHTRRPQCGGMCVADDCIPGDLFNPRSCPRTSHSSPTRDGTGGQEGIHSSQALSTLQRLLYGWYSNRQLCSAVGEHKAAQKRCPSPYAPHPHHSSTSRRGGQNTGQRLRPLCVGLGASPSHTQVLLTSHPTNFGTLRAVSADRPRYVGCSHWWAAKPPLWGRPTETTIGAATRLSHRLGDTTSR